MLSEPKNGGVMETRDRSKRTKIMENESEVITPETRSCIYEHFVPLDLLIEILRSLPLKSLARFLLVSKSWATIIRSRDFIRSFSLQHSLLSQPPLLLACKALDDPNIWRFFSSSSSSASEPLSHLSFTTCANITNPQSRCCSVDTNPRYVNGLISLGFGREQMVCNPRTGKSITLPKVKSRKQIIRTFFGYDPVDCQHKLLCMSEKSYLRSGEPSFEHQVFTLGGVDTSWKMIECSIIHRPQTNGVCINGVVYYGAWMCTHSSDYCLVRFDVRSEKYGQVVQFSSDHCSPSLLSDQDSYLISYKGKVTLAIKGKQLMSYDLWVLKDAEKHEWSKVCISFRHNTLMSSLWYELRIGGDSCQTGDIVFVSKYLGDFYIVYYDHNKGYRIKKIRENFYSEFRRFSVMVLYLNYVESAMLL